MKNSKLLVILCTILVLFCGLSNSSAEKYRMKYAYEDPTIIMSVWEDGQAMTVMCDIAEFTWYAYNDMICSAYVADCDGIFPIEWQIDGEFITIYAMSFRYSSYIGEEIGTWQVYLEP